MKTRSRMKPAISRLMDIVAALAGLILLALVFGLLAVIILMDDGRPIFFRQARVGRNGRPFLILKFRTMRTGTGAWPAITVAGDPRVSRAGRWLRKYKLDELPQFLNVLRGEMGVIGPRPEVPEYVVLEDPLWRRVLRSRPGITDLATLVYRDEEDVLRPAADTDEYYRSTILPAKLRLNVRYQASRSLRRDFKLLWLTVRYSMFPRGFDRGRILRSLGA
jgi:lipopolysaccharide/colanic/teichoic acid biosynthesis glycosyltransferase